MTTERKTFTADPDTGMDAREAAQRISYYLVEGWEVLLDGTMVRTTADMAELDQLLTDIRRRVEGMGSRLRCQIDRDARTVLLGLRSPLPGVRR